MISGGECPGEFCLGTSTERICIEFRARDTHGVVESYAEENISGNLVSYKSVSMAMLSQWKRCLLGFLEDSVLVASFTERES